MKFFFTPTGESGRIVGTTTPNQDETEALAQGYFAEATIQGGPRRWRLQVSFRGAPIFHVSAGNEAQLRELAQDELTRCATHPDVTGGAAAANGAAKLRLVASGMGLSPVEAVHALIDEKHAALGAHGSRERDVEAFLRGDKP